MGEITKKNVLFLCTGNSCRSQMAEGWARHLWPERLKAFSAGIEQHGMNPLAIEVMADAGVDISGQRSKTIEQLGGISFDLVITLCDHARESCPIFPGKVLHHGFADPPRMAAKAETKEEALVFYRQVRDEIRSFIGNIPGNLDEQLRCNPPARNLA